MVIEHDSYRVNILRHGEHAYSLRVIVGGDFINLYNSQDSWLDSAELAQAEKDRILRLLDAVAGDTT